MSLQYIPFQPLFFGELPDDCSICQKLDGTCKDVAGVGGLYANLAQYNDVTQFQLVLGLCGDATQLVTNPNFSGTNPEQLVEDPTFENGVDDYFSDSGSWTNETNGVELTGNGDLVWIIPTGEFGQMFIKINITSIDGTLQLTTNQGVVASWNTAGVKYITVDWTALLLDFTLEFTGSSLGLSLFEVYDLPDIPDWNTSGNVFPDNGLISLNGISTINQYLTLSANSTYLVEINVISITGAPIITVGNGFIEITETGVQQFILNTNTTPFIQISTFGGSSISFQYIKAYDWFEPDDITVEIIPYGSETAAATLGAGSKYISTDSLTVSIDWGTILVDDELIAEGLYYVRVTDCDGSLDSQPIDLATTHECTFGLRACMDNDALQFDFEAFSPFIRLKATFAQPEYNNPDRLRFMDTRDRATNAFSVVNKVKIFQTTYLPEYVLDFLGTLSAYSTLWLGNSQYSVENPNLKPDALSENLTWGTAEIELRMVNYPLRSVRCASEVKDCSPPPNCWQWNDESDIDWNDPVECILLNN